MGTHRTGYGANVDAVGHLTGNGYCGLPGRRQCNEYNYAAYGVFPVDLNFLSALAKHFWTGQFGRNHAPLLTGAYDRRFSNDHRLGNLRFTIGAWGQRLLGLRCHWPKQRAWDLN